MSGRTLLITGASSDVGGALIRSAAKDFDTVIAHYRSMNPKLEALKEELDEKLVLICADFSKEEDITRFISEIREKGLEPTDIVLLPSPQMGNMKYTKILWDEFQTGMDISLRSAFMVTQAFLPAMAKKHSGQVIFMLSVCVMEPTPKYFAQYTSVKYALLGLMRELAVEYGEKGIKINGVSPSVIRTKFWSNKPEMIAEKMAETTKLGRMLSPQEVAEKIHLMLCDADACVNGENVEI